LGRLLHPRAADGLRAADVRHGRRHDGDDLPHGRRHRGLPRRPLAPDEQSTGRPAAHTCESCLLLTRVQELSGVYYTLFRGLFLACFFFSCYGVDLYVWKRYGVT
jgi:hypothetical protein